MVQGRSRIKDRLENGAVEKRRRKERRYQKMRRRGGCEVDEDDGKKGGLRLFGCLEVAGLSSSSKVPT